MTLEQYVESYINGNLSETKQAIFEKPWLQSDIYSALPDNEKDLFMQRCRVWHESRYNYNYIGG